MKNKILFAAGLLFLMPGLILAATWTSYTNTNSVKQITSADGLIWGATSGGVISINPQTDEIDKLTNTDGLGGIDIRCAETDSTDNKWFGTGNGWLTRISPNGGIRNYAFRDSSGLIARPITLYDLERDGGILWVASDLGISKFAIFTNGGEIRDTGRRLGNLPDAEDAVCAEIIGSYLWVGTARGIAFIDKANPNIQFYQNWRSFSAGANGLYNADVRTIAAFHDTTFIGTASGIFKFVTDPDTVWVSTGLDGAIVYKLFMNGDDLIASTVWGLFHYTTNGWVTFTPSIALVINDFALDSGGQLWGATADSGLAELSGDAWIVHASPGPYRNLIQKLAIDSTGGIWMTHDAIGLTLFDSGEWRSFDPSNTDPDDSGPMSGLTYNSQVSVSIAPDGKVWIGSFGGGLLRYDWNSWFRWNYENSPMYGVYGSHDYWAATAVNADENGNIWVSAFGADSLLLMGVYDPDSPDSTWQLFKASEIGLTTNYIQALRTAGNTVWIGRGDGLDRLDNGGTPYNRDDDSWAIRLTTNNIADIEIDPQGIPWLASPSGLFFVPEGADTTLGIELPPLISGAVNTVESDGVGNIWVGTVAGLGIVKPNRVQPWLSTWQALYTAADSPLLDNKINDILIDRPTGIVYIGTEGGLSVFESGVLPPTADLSDMDAYPNPVLLSEGDESIQFKRVPSSGTLTIFTTSGEKIYEIDLSRQNSWNLRNSEGKRVAGGVYFFHVKSGEASGTGKFAIIK